MSDRAKPVWAIVGFVALVCLATAIVSALITARADCVPDPAYSPTPVVTWDVVVDPTVVGIRMYWRYPGGMFQRDIDMPCLYDDAGARWCRGGSMGWPVQRSRSNSLEIIELCVTSYNAVGVESAPSNIVSLCVPATCSGGASCQ